ncbi:methyltransferase domain-containing protein [Paenibacillus xylanilyticus]|uniref:Methyltransferase domain-containing protein n=1 Tax=Paenibacillus xylanilyticus TaxID=248903 RepID=A0A7Y6BRZ0_9BACL|nr:methyltransferase domain-containing protein [Paenibacillus xylanilyticus]NUU73933.1 methyltransferase domain-containing protein [Paenibacillus xylanilyticus]
MRVDLGSGTNKYKDCIGIDRFDHEMTDMVHNFNRPIPMKNDSVDFVMCSHSLQYVDNLNSVMQDIYRICKHGAIVCIVAPYAHATMHMANPQFKQKFNEHSPQYWTTCPGSIQEDNEFSFDSSIVLSQPQIFHQTNMDFRLLKMEFFYFPAYHGLYNELELGILRQSQLNVAHQIMYHLLVVKEAISDEEIAIIKESQRLEEPDYIQGQRMQWIDKEDAEQPYNLENLRFVPPEETVVPDVRIEEKPLMPQRNSTRGSRKSTNSKTRQATKRKVSRRKKSSIKKL